MAKDIKRMTRIELESELVAERAVAGPVRGRRAQDLLGFIVMTGTIAPFAG